MAKPSLFPHFLCFLLFFTLACTARQLPRHEQSQFNECELDSINALEPDNRIESEAGVTETWNPNHPELRCAGVAVIKRTINSNGLHLPSYGSDPELHFVVQGKGVFGIAIPGCAETYTEPQKQRREQRPKLQQLDRHQKIRYLRQGDIVAIPPGIPYWTYNYQNTPLVIISLLDTSNVENQLDRIPRRFYLAGKPEEEYSGSKKSRGGRKGHEEGNNMFGGFERSFLADALNVNEKITEKLQSSGDQIIEVKGGLGIVRPPLEHEVEEREEEERRHRRRRRREEEEARTPEHGEGEGEEEEVIEKKETRTRRTRKHHGEEEGHHEHEVEEEEETTTHEEGEEGEEEVKRHTRTRKRHERHREEGPEGNSLEETVCTLKLHENIADPARADLFNPRAGRISTINSFTLPVLKRLRLSAEWVNLYKDGIYVPHWNINANSVVYVTRGRGRIQVVNCDGKTVFNGEVQRGQLVVVPQNFAVAEQAGSEGMEYVTFRTNDRPMISTMVGPNSAITAIPAEVLANAFGLSPEEVSSLKNNRKEGILASPGYQSQSRDSFIKMV